jgi:hypothetical protein
MENRDAIAPVFLLNSLTVVISRPSYGHLTGQEQALSGMSPFCMAGHPFLVEEILLLLSEKGDSLCFIE